MAFAKQRLLFVVVIRVAFAATTETCWLVLLHNETFLDSNCSLLEELRHSMIAVAMVIFTARGWLAATS